jgi:large-conductance mechanosensitive channel
MTRSRSSLLSDFKDFVNKGNVVDAFVSLVMANILEPALKAGRRGFN